MSRWTQQDVDAHEARMKHTVACLIQAPLAAQLQARQASRTPGRMNKLEAAYAQLLDLRKHAGEILWWKFEGMTLKLAGDTRYTPDFSVVTFSGSLNFYETKGFMREAARVRLNVAASMFPFPFYLVRRVKGDWVIERVKA